MGTRVFLLGSTILTISIASSAQIGDISKRLGISNPDNLSDSKIASGLKEALQVGANNAVKLTGQPNGYFGNAAIKIPLPKNLQSFEKGLRAIDTAIRESRSVSGKELSGICPSRMEESGSRFS